MRIRTSPGALLGAGVLLVLGSCTEAGVVAPDAPDAFAPSLAVVDGSTTGSDDFYFLPPLADGNPNPVGTFNPNLLPGVRVCRLDALLGSCVAEPPVVDFAPGAATASGDHYVVSWDTDGPETGAIDTDAFYRLEVLVGDQVMGWIELDPQDPQGPGQSTFDAYAFRLGETIPVKFWLSTEVLCEDAGFVTECITGAIVDESGANLSLENQGDKLGVILFEGALPGTNHPPVTLTLERIDPALFLTATGEECIPLFDAPQFADCFRLTVTPELTAPLDSPALVSICLDPTALSGIDLPAGQQDQLTMVRYSGSEYEALPDAAGDCPTPSASLVPVPDDGVLRYAALGVNAVARFLGPAPLAAKDIRFGGFTSSFSRFRYVLPGQIVPVAGDGDVIQAADPAEVAAVVEVVDHEGLPVEDAIVHFASSDGTLSTSEVTTGGDGLAAVTWTVDKLTPGDKVLTASALGLLAGPVPEHTSAYLFQAESVDLTVSVVGPPASISRSPTTTVTGAAGQSAGDLTVVVSDAGGLPVAGAAVAWSGDGSVVGGTITDASGSATGEWILPTTAGSATVTATVGPVSATFDGDVQPGPAASLTLTGGGGSATAGSTVPIGAAVTDAFGNPRGGDPLSWTVVAGGGSVAGDAVTAQDGSAAAAFTLGALPGTNSVQVTTGALSETVSVEGVCFDGYGVATVDGSFDSAEWACANSMPFSANLSGGSTPAEVYWMNDGTQLYLAVRVRQSSMAKTNGLRFDFDNDADGGADVGDDVIGFDPDVGAFFDESLDAKCVNRNQSGCSVGGESVDGSGAAANDGTWTVYELAHPLSSGDAADFSLGTGDQVGFFLTLRIGNGAQGNTQFPGFRSYTSIDIGGFCGGGGGGGCPPPPPARRWCGAVAYCVRRAREACGADRSFRCTLEAPWRRSHAPQRHLPIARCRRPAAARCF